LHPKIDPHHNQWPKIAGYLLFLDQLPNQFRLLLLVVDLVAAGLHQWQLRIPPPHVKPPLLFIF
jgi:hypothetical protein